MEIKKVAVIGAGVMGAGIAAHITNAGIPVVLLDIVPEGADNRNVIAEGAVAKMLKTQPAPFMHKKNARLITTGNIEDNLDLLSDCDWIIEAVIERLDIKQSLYKKLDAVRATGSVVSSNTSTIPLHDLVAGQSEAFAEDFMITHFFNPPRYMRLLEITDGEKTRPEVVDSIRRFCDQSLGKGVVYCKDTPGIHCQPHWCVLDSGSDTRSDGPWPDGGRGRRGDGSSCGHTQDRCVWPLRSSWYRSDAPSDGEHATYTVKR